MSQSNSSVHDLVKVTIRLLSRFIRTGWVHGVKEKDGRRMIRTASRVSFTDELCPTWPKSSESLRILALEKYPREKSIIGSNKEARSSVRSPVHAVRAKWTKREKFWSSSDSSRSKLILARPSVLACRVGQGIAHAVRSVPSSGRGFRLRSIPDVPGSSR